MNRRLRVLLAAACAALACGTGAAQAATPLRIAKVDEILQELKQRRKK